MPIRQVLAGGLVLLAALTVAPPVAAAAAGAGGAGGAHVRRADHVVLVVWDGFDADYRHRVPTPNLDALARAGVVTTSTGVMQTITNPSMASLATGAYPERHLNAAYVFDPVADVATAQTRTMASQTLAESLVAQSRTVASIQWFILQDRGVAYGNPTALYTQPGGPCGQRVDQFVDLMAGRPVQSGTAPVTVAEIPDFTAVYCDDLDSLGHRVGADDPQISTQMIEMDRQLGRIVQATRDAGIFEHTAFLVVGDHGMTTYDRAFGVELGTAILAAGFRPQFLAAGTSPAPESNVLINIGGNADLHLRAEAATPQAVATIRAAVQRLPQVRAVLGRAEQRRLRMSPAVGQLVVEPQPGWTPAPFPPAQAAGRHGSTTELSTTFVIAGAGVRPHARPRSPGHVDVAPTISALLGARAPSGAPGRVLSESLSRRW